MLASRLARSSVPVVMLLVVGCGGSETAAPDAPITPDGPPVPRQVVMEIKPLGVGELVEGTLVGGSGDRAVIALSAPVSLDWNIHGHAGNGTQTIEEQRGVMTVDYTFAPPSQAAWSLLLRNAGAAPTSVQVEIELYGDMAWRSWQ